MKRHLAVLMLLLMTNLAGAQVPVTATADQQAWLKSKDATLAANKKLVFDFWREVLEARHVELADKYLTETYIQHNPSVPTGRQPFVDFFKKIGAPMAIEQRIKRGVVSIVAEGDLVVISFVAEQSDPKDSTIKYTTTAFDMFRIENGKIAEHWDNSVKR